MKNIIITFIFCSLFAISAYPQKNKKPPTPLIKNGIVATEGVKIIAIDSTFILKYGYTFNTPFVSKSALSSGNCRNGDPINQVFDLLKEEKYGYTTKKVVVITPYFSKELYGVIMFCNPQKGCDRFMVTRSYKISIPELYAKAALGGKLSCIYEYYECPGTGTDYKWFTWVLWLSDLPFE